PVQVFRAMRNWHPKRDYGGSHRALEARWGAHHFDLQVIRNIQNLSLIQVWKLLQTRQPEAFAGLEGWDALAAFSDLRRRLGDIPVGEHPGYRAGFGRLIDPLVRERVLAVFAQHYPPLPEEEYADVLALNDQVMRWIEEPLGGIRLDG